MLNIKTERDDLIIYLNGRLDVHLSSKIEKELQKLIQKYTKENFIIDLSDVEYMSSSGLRVLVATMRLLTNNGNRKMKLSNLNSAVMKVFEVVELMDMFDIYDSIESALRE